MADLRIFSYIPNPRLAKVKIAALFAGTEIEVVGDKPNELVHWLWDFDAQKLSDKEKSSYSDCARTGSVGFAGVTLYKTDRFLELQPFGSVPAGFSGDGAIGIFESNAIMRAAARLGSRPNKLLGEGPLGESRVDSFLDRTLVYSRDMQRYLLAGKSLTPDQYTEMHTALVPFAAGLNTALESNAYLTGPDLSLADIAVICELSQLTNESGFQDRLAELDLAPLTKTLTTFESLGEHIRKLSVEPHIREQLSPYLDKLLAAWR